MKHLFVIATRFVLLVSICVGSLCLSALAKDKPVVLYVYGDVAADGTVPSGDAEPFHQMRLDDKGHLGMSQFKAALEAVGFDVQQIYDVDVTLDQPTLEKIDVLILGSNQRRFSDAEEKALLDWITAGGGLIAWSDSAFGGHFREVGVDNELGRLSNNDLTEPYGMYFMTDNGAGNYLVTQYEDDHFINNFQKDGGVDFRGEGVSVVRVSPPARMLARFQEGGLGGGLRLSKVDGKMDPDRDAALAIAEVGKGRVVGVFDRNLFWNAGPGTRLSHSDNREFAQRITLWAAGLDNTPGITKKIASRQEAGRNTPPSVQVSYDLAKDGKYVDLSAVIDDNDDDTQSPEITWKQVKGPKTAEFENNNPNVASVRVLLKEPGEYAFVAEVKDGEFFIRKWVGVKVPSR
ncbi:hypothetical protein [Rubellicoccus peritrichatus]|uniref:ThuA-like domain-containing protein n=1 Tax=Rubellicoccus peritrichatus TaxID=3080537 RepID=A0AAQ3QU80_9BACT|nr:hypothetical protein [Puniceicoccus sp. CR14]WOO40188.1 hypothetical protein RZN69_16325 [Puniceicoccus sp. CR14]